MSNDSYVETVIPKSDDDLLPKYGTLSTETQEAKKRTREKGTQYENATIKKKFIQIVNVITYHL